MKGFEKYLIKIYQREADYLIENVPTRKLKKASGRKKHGGKTYYVLNDDYDSLKVVAMLRDYKPVKRFVIDNDGNKKEIEISPAQQLLEDN